MKTEFSFFGYGADSEGFYTACAAVWKAQGKLESRLGRKGFKAFQDYQKARIYERLAVDFCRYKRLAGKEPEAKRLENIEDCKRAVTKARGALDKIFEKKPGARFAFALYEEAGKRLSRFAARNLKAV